MTEWAGFAPGYTPDGLQRVGLSGSLRSFEKQEVFCLRILEGEGVEDNPSREVVYWIHPDGWVIQRHDAWERGVASERTP